MQCERGSHLTPLFAWLGPDQIAGRFKSAF